MSAEKLPADRVVPSLQAEPTFTPLVKGGEGRSADSVERDRRGLILLLSGFLAGVLATLAAVGGGLVGWAS